METVGVTIRLQRQFDLGFREDDEIARAAQDLATEVVEQLDAGQRNQLTDIMETGVGLWDALEAIGAVRLYREPSQAITDPCRCLECVETRAVRDRCDPENIGSVEYLMRASVQPDKRGSRSRSKGAKKAVGPYRGEPAMLTSYGWKLPTAS